MSGGMQSLIPKTFLKSTEFLIREGSLRKLVGTKTLGGQSGLIPIRGARDWGSAAFPAFHFPDNPRNEHD